MRPLDRLGSIKTKLGVVIVAAVAVTVAVVAFGVEAGIPIWPLGVIAGLASLGMVQFLARGMTSPLREMASAARAMAKGDYARRVTASSNDEVGELARAFNRMSADLAEVDRTRRDLIANVSHELRTPISALQALLENILDGVQDADPAVLQTMLSQVERLGHLIRQLLDLSRLESGAESLHKERVELEPMLRQTLREAALADPSVRLEASVEPSGLVVEADPVKLHQVVANLIDNAVRHSPNNGTVTVSAKQDGGITIEVVDQGPGIPEELRERVFERFYRSDQARPGGDRGSGLGLSIARWIVELHGGEVQASSNGDGGCRMIVTLPRGES
jgi:signal transduction histidine kinase